MIIGTEKRRAFQPPWYTVTVYECPYCDKQYRMRDNFNGPRPPGAFVCNCGATLGLNGKDHPSQITTLVGYEPAEPVKDV